jgi:hypothetical protein
LKIAILKGLAEEIRNGQSALKNWVSVCPKKVPRFKLGAGANGPFEMFEAVEFLSLGILGKLSLWSGFISPCYRQLTRRSP